MNLESVWVEKSSHKTPHYEIIYMIYPEQEKPYRQKVNSQLPEVGIGDREEG